LVRAWKFQLIDPSLIPNIDDHLSELESYSWDSALFERAEAINKMLRERQDEQLSRFRRAPRLNEDELRRIRKRSEEAEEVVEDAKDKLASLRCLASRHADVRHCNLYETRLSKKVYRVVLRSLKAVNVTVDLPVSTEFLLH
jgi:hypothetical protein